MLESMKNLKDFLGKLNREERASKVLKKMLFFFFFFLPNDCVKDAANQESSIVTEEKSL